MKHEEIRKAFSVVYNDFYLKYKDNGQIKTDDEWQMIYNKANEFIRDFNYESLVRDMIMGIIEQIELADRTKRLSSHGEKRNV